MMLLLLTSTAILAVLFHVNFGLQYPSSHGVLRRIIPLVGGTVTQVDPHIGLFRRGIYKSHAETNSKRAPGNTTVMGGRIQSARYSSMFTFIAYTVTVGPADKYKDMWFIDSCLAIVVVMAAIGVYMLVTQWLRNHRGNYAQALMFTIQNSLFVSLLPHRCVLYAVVNTALLSGTWHMSYAITGNLLLLFNGWFGTWIYLNVRDIELRRLYTRLMPAFILVFWQTPLNYVVPYDTFIAICTTLGDVINNLAGYSGPALACAEKACDGTCGAIIDAVSAAPAPTGSLGRRFVSSMVGSERMQIALDFGRANPNSFIGGTMLLAGAAGFTGAKGVRAAWRAALYGKTPVAGPVYNMTHHHHYYSARPTGLAPQVGNNVAASEVGLGAKLVTMRGGVLTVRSSLPMSADQTAAFRQSLNSNDVDRSHELQSQAPLSSWEAAMSDSSPAKGSVLDQLSKRVTKDPFAVVVGGATLVVIGIAAEVEVSDRPGKTRQ